MYSYEHCEYNNLYSPSSKCYKTFLSKNDWRENNFKWFSLERCLQPGLIFVSVSWACSTKISQLTWKTFPVTNTLAYLTLIMKKKSFRKMLLDLSRHLWNLFWEQIKFKMRQWLQCPCNCKLILSWDQVIKHFCCKLQW